MKKIDCQMLGTSLQLTIVSVHEGKNIKINNTSNIKKKKEMFQNNDEIQERFLMK